MAMYPTAQLQEKLKSCFDYVDYWAAEPDLGLKRLPVSGQFIRIVDFDEWVSRVKALLPDDAKLILFDSVAIRTDWPSDMWLMFFGSKTWETVPEGEIVPAFQPLFLNEKIADSQIFDLQILNVPVGVEFRLVINKHTHALSIPKDQETDEQCVVVVRPRG